MTMHDIQLKPVWKGCKRKWETISPLHYKTRLGWVTVPKGFITDLGSIPFLVDRFIDPIGIGIESYILHDFLYLEGHINGKPITRRQADKILITQLKEYGMGMFKRRIVATGLYLGGWKAWGKHRKLSTR